MFSIFVSKIYKPELNPCWDDRWPAQVMLVYTLPIRSTVKDLNAL